MKRKKSKGPSVSDTTKNEGKPKIQIGAMDIFRATSAAAKASLTSDAAKAVTHDGFENFIAKVGLHQNNAMSESTYDFNLVTRNRILLEAAYRGSWIVGVTIDAVADDMTKAGIDITTSDKSDLRVLHQNMARLKIWQSLNTTIKWGRLYGGALGVMQIEGQDLATPLDVSTVGKDQFKGVVAYDRWQLNPVLTPVIQSGPDIGLPEYYEIVTTATTTDPQAPNQTGQQTVHHSRCIRYIGIDLPFFQAITEMLWGESVLERLWDRLISFDNVALSSAQLVDRANLRKVGVQGFREIIAAGGAALDGLTQMFEMMRLYQTNEGLTLMDKEDDYETTSYSFAGLDGMLLMQAQQLSGATGIPLIRLFGQSPPGLGNTAETDLRMYYENINAQQEAKLRNPLDVLLKVLWRSTFGRPQPEDFEYSFEPLWQLDDKGKSEVARTTTETVLGAYESGLISAPTALKELRDNSNTTGIFSNITDEEITKAELEPPPLPDAADPFGVEPEPPVTPEKIEVSPAKAVDAKTTWWARFFGRDSNFKEADHPRASNGQFGSGGGASKAPKKSRKKIATAPTKEKVVGLLEEYFHAKKTGISLKEENGVFVPFHKSGKKIEGLEVTEKKGRWIAEWVMDE